MEQFKLKKVALAVSSAIGALGFAGMADAADVTAAITVSAPKIGGTFTAATGASNKLRVVGTNTGTAANGAALRMVLVDAGTPVYASAITTTTDADAGTGAFSLTASAGAYSTNNVIALLELNTGLGYDGTNAFGAGTNAWAVVSPAGAIVSVAATSGQEAVNVALAASNTIPVNSTYAGPVITAATQASATGAITLSFNAGLSGHSTNASATIGGSTSAVAGVVASSVINGAAVSGAVFGTGTNAVSAGATAATVSVASTATGFSVGVNRVGYSGAGSTIYDQAGNQAVAQNVATNFTGGIPAYLNGTAGVNAVVTSIGGANATDAWTGTATGAAVVGAATVKVQFKEAIDYDAGYTYGTDANSAVMISPATVASGATVAPGTDGSVSITLSLAGVSNVAFDANGQLQVKVGTTWSPVTVGFNDNGTNGWYVTTTNTGMAGTADSLAAMNVMAGVVPTPTVLTLDGNTDGYVEGLTVNANGPTFAGTDASVSLLNVVTGTATFASTQSLQTGNGKLDIKLANALNTYDWNQDGTVGNTGDAVSLVRFGTGAVASGTNALGFSLQTAGGTSGGSATYGNVYREFDGAKLPVRNSDTAATVTSFTDNANPVLVGTVYAQDPSYDATNPGTTPSGTRVPYGTVTLTFSEPIDADSPLFGNSTAAGGPGSGAGLSEILFNGKPATLVNLDANIAKQLDATIGNGVDPITANAAAANSAVVLNNMPNVTGQAVSISYAGAWQIYDDNAGAGVTTTGIFPALVSSSTAAFTATEQVDTSIKFTKASLKSTYVAGQKIDTIILDVSKNVARQTGYTDADFNGTFIVRARVGSTRGGAFEQRDGGTWSDDSFYDFYVAGSNVKVATESALGGAAKVVLFVPPNTPSNQTAGGIPGDTKELWVDYQPNNTSTGQLVNAANSASAVNNPEAARFGGVPVTAASGTAITTDDDTLSVTFSPIRLANFASVANTGQLLTQAVIGTAKSGGNALPDNAGVRVDLVSLTTPQAAVSGSYRDAVIGDGRVDLQRGPNSESSDLQTVALKNLGFDIKFMQAYYAALQAYNAAVIAKDKVKLPAAANVLAMQFGVPSGTGAGFADSSTSTASTLTTAQATAVPAFVQVTTGAGALASAGTNGANGDNSRGNYSGVGEAYSQNANAEYGRTATLVRTPAAIEKNGFTSYPVEINLANGTITALGGNNAVGGGALNLNAGSIPVPYTNAGARRFKILDSAYGLVKNGKYNMMVGVPEKDFDAKLVGLEPNVEAAPNTFVLVSARNTSTGKWTLITPADPTFTGGVTGTAVATAPRFLPFRPDLKSNGMPTKVDFDLGLINGVTVKDQASWQLIGMPGVMLRDATKPLTPRFFMTVKQGDGEPVSFWENDDSSKDEAFTLGGGAVANEVKIMAEVGAATVNTGVNPKPAAGLAFNKNAAGKAVADTTANVAVTDTLVGGTESGTADVMDTALGATNDLMLFYPVKGNTSGVADAATGTLAKGSWHLVTVTGTGRTFGDLSTRGVDAAIVIDTTGGSAKTWFANETTDLNTTAVAKGTALFVHTTAGTGTATFDY
jgi:hypothetical protein